MQASEFTTITLDGSSSTKPDGTTLTYSWAQKTGPEAVILTASEARTDVELPVVEMTTDFTFELSISDGTVTDTETTRLSVAKTPIPAPQGDALAGVGYPQDRPFTSIGIAKRNDPDTDDSRSIVFLARPTEDGSAGEIVEFNPESNQFSPALVNEEFPSDVKISFNARETADGVTYPNYLFMSSEASDRVWIYSMNDSSIGPIFGEDPQIIPAGTIFTFDVPDPCRVSLDLENRYSEFSSRFIDRASLGLTIGTRQGLHSAEYVEFSTSRFDPDTFPFIDINLEISEGEFCTQLTEGSYPSPERGIFDVIVVFRTASLDTEKGASIVSSRSIDLDSLLPPSFRWSADRELNLLPDLYSDLKILDIVGPVNGHHTILASDGQKGGRHVIYDYFITVDDVGELGASYEWSEGQPTGLLRLSDSSVAIVDPTLPYLRTFPLERFEFPYYARQRLISGQRLAGAPDFREHRFGVFKLIPYNIPSATPTIGVYGLYDAVPGLENEFKSVTTTSQE